MSLQVHFELHGENGLFAYVEKVIEKRGHCVICIAEGAGQVRNHRLHYIIQAMHEHCRP